MKLSQTFYGYLCSTLISSCGRILRHVWFLSLLKDTTRPNADSLPIAFPRAKLNSDLWSLSDSQIQVSFLCLLTNHVSDLALPPSQYSQKVSLRAGICVIEAPRTPRIPMA